MPRRVQRVQAHRPANCSHCSPPRSLPQAVLQLLFGALQAQGAALCELQSRVGSLDAAASAAAGAAVRQEEAATVADARLAALESRLHGASNVAGRQAALDEIASLIGVAVPEVGAGFSRLGGLVDAPAAQQPGHTSPTHRNGVPSLCAGDPAAFSSRRSGAFCGPAGGCSAG